MQNDSAQIQIVISEDDFSLDRTYGAVRQYAGANLGAVATFIGLVRDRNSLAGDGSAVASLTLEHYPGMTEKSIYRIARDAFDRWDLLTAHIHHRIGRLAPTEQIVMVVVGAGHRADAFAAAEFIMDYLKTDAVLWKKEVSENSQQWLKSTDADQARAQGWSQPEP